MLRLGVQDDPLMFSFTKVNLYINKSKLFRLIFYLILFYQVILISVSIFCIFFWNQSHLFMDWKYLPFIGISMAASISNFSTLFQDEIAKMPGIVAENAWCLKSGGQKTYARIVKTCRFIRIFQISSFIPLFLCVIAVAPYTESDKKWGAPAFLIDRYSNVNWKVFLMIPYYLTFTITVYSFLMNLSLFDYITCQLTFQYHILNHYVIRLVKESMTNNDRLGYQEDIYKHIVTLVRMQSQILKFRDMIIKYADFGTLGMTLVAVLLILCVSAFIILDVYPESNLRVFLSLVPMALFTANLCSNGQRAKFESEMVYNNALECGWYHWNTKNRQAYQIFLINNTKPVQFSKFGVYDIDYRHLIYICRTGYALFTLIMNISGRTV